MGPVRTFLFPVALALLTPAALVAPESSLAGDGTGRTVTPVFHQLVMFTLPAPFKAAYEKTSSGFYIREHVPEGQTVDDWSQMITLTGTKDLASKPEATPQQYVAALVRGFRRHCTETFSGADLGPQTIGGYSAFAGIASCGRVDAGGTGKSETAVILAVKGSDDYYVLQWAEHAAASNVPPPIDKGNWSARLAKLNPVKLCPIVPGEAAPYPSCTARQP